MRDADHPSLVVANYLVALKDHWQDTDLHAAYVEQMVKRGRPDLAHDAARKLVALDGDQGLGWAVAAHAATVEGDLATAVWAGYLAIQKLPDDPFVLETVGAVLAWYDHDSDTSRLDDSRLDDLLTAALAQTRQLAAGKAAFAQAYTRTITAYAEAAVSRPVEPAAPAPRVEIIEVPAKPVTTVEVETVVAPHVTYYPPTGFISLGYYGHYGDYGRRGSYRPRGRTIVRHYNHNGSDRRYKSPARRYLYRHFGDLLQDYNRARRRTDRRRTPTDAPVTTRPGGRRTDKPRGARRQRTVTPSARGAGVIRRSGPVLRPKAGGGAGSIRSSGAVMQRGGRGAGRRSRR